MRLPWISKKEHDKEMDLKDHIIQGWICKCNNLEKDIVEKEDVITNHIDSDLENALENQHLRIRVKNLEKMVEWHEENECKLNKERIKYNFLYAHYKKLYHDYKRYYRKTLDATQTITNEKVEAEQELARATGKLDKIKNAYRMLTGKEID